MMNKKDSETISDIMNPKFLRELDELKSERSQIEKGGFLISRTLGVNPNVYNPQEFIGATLNNDLHGKNDNKLKDDNNSNISSNINTYRENILNGNNKQKNYSFNLPTV